MAQIRFVEGLKIEIGQGFDVIMWGTLFNMNSLNDTVYYLCSNGHL